MGTRNSRRDKIEWMQDTLQTFFIKEPAGSISKKKLLAQFSLQTSATKRTGEEILEIFINTEQYIIKDREIFKK